MLGSWQALLDYLRADMAHEPIERVRVLFLNAKNVLIANETMWEGSVDESAVYVREIMRRALDLHATAIIVVHNHPSRRPLAQPAGHPPDPRPRRGRPAPEGDAARPCHRRRQRPSKPARGGADLGGVGPIRTIRIRHSSRQPDPWRASDKHDIGVVAVAGPSCCGSSSPAVRRAMGFLREGQPVLGRHRPAGAARTVRGVIDEADRPPHHVIAVERVARIRRGAALDDMAVLEEVRRRPGRSNGCRSGGRRERCRASTSRRKRRPGIAADGRCAASAADQAARVSATTATSRVSSPPRSKRKVMETVRPATSGSRRFEQHQMACAAGLNFDEPVPRQRKAGLDLHPAFGRRCRPCCGPRPARRKRMKLRPSRSSPWPRL